ncbi:protein OS-9 homolog [[Candida] railenensis]|uniref:Endoplasmic reticulum lectin n=1 Tax=[Candida] railenensis TaxID=45579 RepID=A0A9P0QP05_9ASCO|nr:protein OS-9 homolog [[Candida] railenensis]
MFKFLCLPPNKAQTWMIFIYFLLLLPFSNANIIIPPKYSVKFHNSKISSNLASSYLQLNDHDSNNDVGQNGHFQVLKSTYTQLQDTNSRDYLCYIPQVEINDTSILVDENAQPTADLLGKAVRILNSSFSTKECVFAYGFNGGYFTFAYCFGDKVIQYHENMEYFIKTKKHKPENPDFIFVLGKFEGSNFKETKIENQCNWKEKDSERLNPKEFQINDDTINPFNQKNVHSTQKFIEHTLTDGGICDWTGEPRTIDIIYKCDPKRGGNIHVIDVNEIKTCEYQMVISVPQLCQLKEFQPSKVEDEVIEIGCKEIEVHEEHENGNWNRDGNNDYESLTVDSFLKSRTEEDLVPIKGRDLFPIRNDYKIQLSDYTLSPFGQGFFSAISRTPIASENSYFKHRHVIVYNNEYESNMDLINKFGRMFHNIIGRKILSPLIDKNTGMQQFITWDDTFIIWFEMYDFYGNFISLVKVSRDGEEEIKSLSLQLINPETMVDHDGDFVEIGEYQSPNGAVNFQKFEQRREVEPPQEQPGISFVVTVKDKEGLDSSVQQEEIAKQIAEQMKLIKERPQQHQQEEEGEEEQHQQEEEGKEEQHQGHQQEYEQEQHQEQAPPDDPEGYHTRENADDHHDETEVQVQEEQLDHVEQTQDQDEGGMIVDNMEAVEESPAIGSVLGTVEQPTRESTDDQTAESTVQSNENIIASAVSIESELESAEHPESASEEYMAYSTVTVTPALETVIVYVPATEAEKERDDEQKESVEPEHPHDEL